MGSKGGGGQVRLLNVDTWELAGFQNQLICRFILAAYVVGGGIRVYLLQCKKCKAFYIGKTGQMLSKRVNGHLSTCTVMNSDLPVPIHTQSHQLHFQECWSIRVIHKLPDATPDHVRHQYQTAYHLVLKSRQFPGINIRQPHSASSPSPFYPLVAPTNTLVSLCLQLKKATVLAESSN